MGCVWQRGCLLLPVLCLAVAVDVQLELETHWDWGSGLQELLHSFPADSPFVTETADRPANCTQRFWLPPSSPVCWDNIVGPEEFEQSRLLALQNRAALRAVAEAGGVAEGGISYSKQAQEDLRGFRAEQLSFQQTADTMQKVFHSLEEKRREGTELWTFSSLKEQLGTRKDSIHSWQQLTDLLEKQVNHLERSLNTLQRRLAKLQTQ